MTTNNAVNNTLPLPFTIGITSLTVVPFNKINTQSITATGAFTYTPTSGTLYAIFELQAGGGGSGGTTGAGGQAAAAGAGGGGAYQKILVFGNTNLAAITGSVGIAGTAASSGNHAGGNGGDTTLIINSGSTWTSSGGIGGTGQTSSASAQLDGGAGAGGTNTSGTNGILIIGIAGLAGSTGFSNGVVTTIVMGPQGGDSFLGRGGSITNGTGSSGTGYGAGASGTQNAIGSNAVGIAGKQGIVIVTEFICS